MITSVPGPNTTFLHSSKKPLVGVGRFTDPDVMAQLVRSGVLDCIGSARGSIADPFLPAKIESGRTDEIRECIGCNICVSRFNQHAPIICTQNPTIGEEYRRGWHPERFTRAENADRNVLVIGAGPAGLECATTLGRRGMNEVHLVERSEDVGGALNLITRLPGFGEWGRLITYRRSLLERLPNVKLITGKEFDPEEALAYGAEFVVVATGSRWAADGLNGVTRAPIAGAGLPNAFTPEEIMSESAAIPGGPVVVYDTDGYFMGSAIALHLSNLGHDVTIVTPHGQASPYTIWTLEYPRLERLIVEAGISVKVLARLEEIASDHVRIVSGTSGKTEILETSNTVLVTQRIPSGDIYANLKERHEEIRAAGIERIFRIGSCVAPRLIADSIFDGHRLAREIDSEDPSSPLPYRRERRVVTDHNDIRLIGQR